MKDIGNEHSNTYYLDFKETAAVTVICKNLRLNTTK